MTFDFARTLSLVKGGLFDHRTTWESYLQENPGWQQTAMLLTGPLVLANVLLSTIFSRITGGFAYPGYDSNIFAALFSGLVMACLGFVVAVFAFNFLAGVFKGKQDFSRVFAAISLAAIPSWVAGVLGALVPAFGFLIILAGGIMSLVFLYKIMPLALAVPEDKRLAHFIVSLLVIFILNILIGSIIGINSLYSSVQRDAFNNKTTTSGSLTGSGVLGEFERQGRLMEDADEDNYDPPADDKLTKSQVVAYVKVLKKTRAVHAEYANKAQKFADKMEAKEKAGETPSGKDLSQLYSGIGGVMSMNNAEMEIVKTGQGNWAEHLWVKEQLHIAQIQQGDGSEALAHNYKLFKKYKEDLD